MKKLFVLALVLLSASFQSGCATSSPPAPADPSELREVYDPLETMNRHIYRFNANFDEYVFIPVVNGYRFVFPQFLRTGISNIFDNIGEATIIVNSILQFAPVKTAKSLARLTLNSTLGIGGFFDVAQYWELPSQDEDFGQTLAFYGVGPGPFLVVPILGPSSFRDASGMLVDRAMISVPLMVWVPSATPYTTAAGFLEAIQTRDDLTFRYGELGPFEYNLIRGLYLEYRRIQVGE